MGNYQIELTEEGRENIEETINCFIQSAQAIAESSEADFEKIKNKKWYNRLWEMITFSKDNKKIQARGVSNLAKLNEITMKAIVVLSKYSAETAAIISESVLKIENLENCFSQLATGMKKIALEVKSLKYDYKKSLTISDLDVAHRDIVGSLFYKYVRLCLSDGLMPTSDSQNFYTLVMDGDNPEEDISIEKHLDLLDNDTQLLLYRLNQSYYYLIKNEFDDSDYFDDFDISKKNIKIIKEQIETSIKLMGADNYCSSFFPSNEIYFVDDENIDFKEIDEELFEEDDDQIEVTEIAEKTLISVTFENLSENIVKNIRVCSMTQVKPDEEIVIENAEIHVESIVNCCGNVTLKNCIVFYNEDAHNNTVKLSSNAKINANCCAFVCKGYSSLPFISSDNEEGEISISNSVLYDCSNFISSVSSVKMIDSQLKNCCSGVVFEPEFSEIKNITIEMDAIKEFNLVDDMNWMLHLTDCSDKSSACNVSVVVSEEMVNSKSGYIIADTVDNCSFVNAHRCVIANSLTNCSFKKCSNAVARRRFSSSSVVKNCSFIESKRCIEECTGMEISECKFTKCNESIIYQNGSCSTGVSIAFCEFVECSNCVNMDLIELYGTSDSKTCLKNCVFNKVDAGTRFIIKSNISEKKDAFSIEVSNCDFRNCTTERSTGVLANRYCSVFKNSLSLKMIDVTATSIHDCTGLDDVRIIQTKAVEIDDKFYIDGKGVVLICTVPDEISQISCGDKVTVCNKVYTIRGLAIGRHLVEKAIAGDECEILIDGFNKEDIDSTEYIILKESLK